MHGAFLSPRSSGNAAGCAAQQLRLYIGATALGSEAFRWIRSPLASTITEAPRWKLLAVSQLGDDARLDYLLEGEEEGEQSPSSGSGGGSRVWHAVHAARL